MAIFGHRVIITQPYLWLSNSYTHKKNTTLLEIREKPITSHVLNHTKKQRDKDFKTKRDNWILFRGLRRENELTKTDQKIDCIIENMYIKSGLDLEFPI